MAKASAFTVFLVGHMQWLGPVTSRRMFGGTGLFLEGLMFALIVENTLYLKADTAIRGDFDALGLPPLRYERNGRDIALSYLQAPDAALDDRDLLIDWAHRGYAAAIRAAAAKGGLKRDGVFDCAGRDVATVSV